MMNPDIDELKQDGNRKSKIVIVEDDVMMPRMNGYDVCRRIKADPSTEDIPVIFLTAMSKQEDIAEGFSSNL